MANEVPSIIVSLASFGKLNNINSYFIKGEREREREAEWLHKFRPFLNFGSKCIYKIEMKQKQNRNLVIETLNGGKYKKGNLTKTVNVKKVT